MAAAPRRCGRSGCEQGRRRLARAPQRPCTQSCSNELRRDAALAPAQLRRRKYLSTALQVIDELGFEPMNRQEASLFFRRVTYCYGHGAVRITTNKSVKDWTEPLARDESGGDSTLDRLLHKAHLLNIKGRSYRLRDLEQSLGMQR